MTKINSNIFFANKNRMKLILINYILLKSTHHNNHDNIQFLTFYSSKDWTSAVNDTTQLQQSILHILVRKCAKCALIHTEAHSIQYLEGNSQSNISLYRRKVSNVFFYHWLLPESLFFPTTMWTELEIWRTPTYSLAWVPLIKATWWG